MAIHAPDRAAPAPVTEDPRTLGAPAALQPLYEVSDALRPLYETIADCPSCVLAKTRSRTVPGSGPVTADLMFVGEAPGQREDDWGLPFVGRSGQFLDELLAAINLTRRDVYVTNVVKCRPPGNRDPEPAEIAACSAYLEQQIELVSPKVIATLWPLLHGPLVPGREDQSHPRAGEAARRRPLCHSDVPSGGRASKRQPPRGHAR